MKIVLPAFIATLLLFANFVKSQSSTPKYLSVLSGNYYLSNDHLIPVGNAQALSVGNTRFSWLHTGDGLGSATITRLDSAARPVWSKYYDMRDTDTNRYSSVFADIKSGKDGNFGLVGNTGMYLSQYGTYPSYGTGFILKINTSGAVIWSNKLRDTSAQLYIPLSIAACSDTGFVVCGKILANPTSTNSKSFIARLGKNGNLLWMKKDTTSVNSFAHSIVNVGDSSFYMIGARTVMNKDITTIWHLNSSGALQWTQSYALGVNGNRGYSIINGANGLYCLGSEFEIQLFKISYSGAVVFAKKYDGYAAYNIEENCKPKLKTIRNNQLLISNSAGSPAAIITNSIGNVQWSADVRTYNLPTDVIQLNNKDFLFSKNDDYKIVVLDNDSLVWGQEGFVVTDSLGTGSARCYNLSTVSESISTVFVNTVVTGFQNTGTLTAFQTTVTIVNANAKVGCLAGPTGLLENDYLPLKIFPNPATNKLFFESGEISLNGSKFTLTDLQGKLVFRTILNSNEHGTLLALDNVSPGVYFYRIETAQKEFKVGKLIIAQGD
jgi:hypothetical protein